LSFEKEGFTPSTPNFFAKYAKLHSSGFANPKEWIVKWILAGCNLQEQNKIVG